ncbi:MAG: GumC family protein [Leptolyngbyaceae cyanobacterium]
MEQQDYKNYKDYVEQIDLQRYWLVIKRRWLPTSVVVLLCVLAAAYAALNEKSQYRAAGQVLVQGRDRSASLTGIATELATQETLGRETSALATQQQLMQSTQVLAKVVEELDIKGPDGAPLDPGALRSGLATKPLPGTNIVLITYESPNPELAAAIVNQLMESYIEKNVENNRTEARTARLFIEAELPRAKDAVDTAAEQLRLFKVRNEIVNLEQESAATVNLLEAIEHEIRDQQAELAAVSAQVSALENQLALSPQRAQDLAKLNDAESVQAAIADLAEVQSQLATERANYTENHPIVASLRRQEAALLDLLNDRVESVVGQSYGGSVGDYEFSPVEANLTTALLQSQVQQQAMEQRLQDLQNTRAQYVSWSEVFPALEKEELQLRSGLGAAQQEYELLLGRLQEVRLAENQTVGTARIQELAAVPPAPLDNRSTQIKLIIAGAGAGVFLGVAVAFALDLLDKSIKTAKDAEALLGYTLLGLIPKFTTSPDEADADDLLLSQKGGISPRIVTKSGTHPLIAAAYQMLQANLKFIRSDSPLRIFVVSSSVAKEGKSEVSANLAVSMAQVGRRVLLVDADMRSPSQHHLWNVINRVGLSHVLVGEGTLQDALQPVAENVTLLTAGVVPPNPLALVDSERMATLMTHLSKQYDYVILDSPPLIGAADAAVLGRMADGVLLIVRPRQVDSASALATKALLSRSGAEVLGFVANGVNVNNEHDDYVSHTRTKFDFHTEEEKALPFSLENTPNGNGTHSQNGSDPFQETNQGSAASPSSVDISER